MKASYINATGPASEIVWGELPTPMAGAGQVVVRVEAVAVDHVDLFARSGRWKTDLRFPQSVGRDLVGAVTALGDGLDDRFQLGDRVWTNSAGYDGRPGATAEYVAVEADRLYRAPVGAEAVDLVALLHPGATAYGVLERVALHEHETIVVTGANGAVGAMFVHAAAGMGSRVVAISRDARAEPMLRRYGASEVVVADGDHAADAAFDASPNDVDVFVEVSGHTALEPITRRLNRRGRLAILTSRRPFAFDPWTFYTRELTLYGFVMSGMTVPELTRAADAINSAYARGVRLALATPMGLDQARSAHEILEAGGPEHDSNGFVPRIVLTPRNPARTR